jgi:KipI family sensor histidine kinase inhibitor
MTQPFILRPAGPTALLVEFETAQLVRDYYGEACRRRDAGSLSASMEFVPGARTILFDGVEEPVALARGLRGWRPAPDSATATRKVDVPTHYDGPDLAVVAEVWSMRIAEVVELHAGLPHVVAFHGFAPGFAYLSGIPEHLSVPRRPSPRAQVPRGSVALAGLFTGVYPRASPGGWQLIGRTEVPLWDETAQPAAYLLPGDHVRFVPLP